MTRVIKFFKENTDFAYALEDDVNKYTKDKYIVDIQMSQITSFTTIMVVTEE